MNGKSISHKKNLSQANIIHLKSFDFFVTFTKVGHFKRHFTYVCGRLSKRRKVLLTKRNVIDLSPTKKVCGTNSLMKLATLCVLKENVLRVLNRILKSYRIWRKNRKMKLKNADIGGLPRISSKRDHFHAGESRKAQIRLS